MEDADENSNRRISFLNEMNKLSNHNKIINKALYNEIIKDVIVARTLQKKTARQYRRLRRYDILEISNDVHKLIEKSAGDNLRYYVPLEEMFDILEYTHIATGHGGRNRMVHETSKKYANITREVVSVFLSMCETCKSQRQAKRKHSDDQEEAKRNKLGLGSKPTVQSEMNSKCQVDLIDFQFQPDEDYKFIMVYQDYWTKFVILKPLKSNCAPVIANQLLEIFLTFGSPCILHCGKKSEFLNEIINEMALLWPELKIVYGKACHSEGALERANQDIKNMLTTWMKDNNTTKWSDGLNFVQFMKNRSYHSDIKQSPYKAMFGMEPRIGLSSTKLPAEILSKIRFEKDIDKLFDNGKGQSTEMPEKTALR